MEVWWPWLKGLAPLLPAVIILWLAFRKAYKPLWLQEVSRLGSTLATFVLVLFSLFLLSAQGCEEDRALIGSPDGKHVARMLIWGSVPTGTSLRIIERKSWSPTWQTVSVAGSAGTPLEPIEPKVIWLSNHRLMLDYPEPISGFCGFECKSGTVGDIELICRVHPNPSAGKDL